MRNLGSSPTREAPSIRGGTACSPGHPFPPGPAARGKSGASPRRCPRARPRPGASGGGRARPGLREALSRAPSACQNLRLRFGARPPRRSLPPAPGERPRRPLPPANLLRPGWEEKGRPHRSPRAAAPRGSARAAGRGWAAGLRPLPPRPLPALPQRRRLRPPASAGPGPRRPRCPEAARGERLRRGRRPRRPSAPRCSPTPAP